MHQKWSLRIIASLSYRSVTHLSRTRLFSIIRTMKFLQYLSQIRESFKSRFHPHIKFNFSDVDKAQRLHKQMQLLTRSPGSLQKVIADPEKLKKLQTNIEQRAKFRETLSKQNASSTEVSKNVRFVAALKKGYGLLRDIFEKLIKFLHAEAEAGSLKVPQPVAKQVERRDVSELSVAEFLDKYARPGLPVIITGLNVSGEEDWTLDFFKRKCNVTAMFMRKNASKKSWGRLESAGVLPLAEFIETFTSNETRRKWYLHDWGLPRHCPEAFGPAPFLGFRMPKYFVGDYFQRAAFDGYQHSWPSLFIGSGDTQSAMHIDSGGTNFWMYLFTGRKDWRFYSYRDLLCVYKHPTGAHFSVDVFQPDHARFPLLKYAEVFEGIQEPVELIFIPGGNPHGVRNLEDIHAISMNYADASNIYLHLWTILMDGNYQSFEIFTDKNFPHGIRSEQQDLSFGEWKSTDWTKLTYDLHA